MEQPYVEIKVQRNTREYVENKHKLMPMLKMKKAVYCFKENYRKESLSMKAGELIQFYGSQCLHEGLTSFVFFS